KTEGLGYSAAHYGSPAKHRLKEQPMSKSLECNLVRSIGLVALLVLTSSAQTPAVADKQIEVFGQKIHYLEAGTGPTVILLHGLGGDVSNWALTVPALANQFHVLAIDQIGFGKSDKPLLNYRIGTMVD